MELIIHKVRWDHNDHRDQGCPTGSPHDPQAANVRFPGPYSAAAAALDALAAAGSTFPLPPSLSFHFCSLLPQGAGLGSPWHGSAKELS